MCLDMYCFLTIVWDNNFGLFFKQNNLFTTNNKERER